MDRLEVDLATASYQQAQYSERLAGVEKLSVDAGQGVIRMRDLLDDFSSELEALSAAAARSALADALSAETAATMMKTQAKLDDLRETLQAATWEVSQIQSANALELDRVQGFQAQLEKLEASVSFLEKRIGDEAEQSRRALTALYDQFRASARRRAKEESIVD
jgi:chromosome segregation ATPase